MKKAYLVKSFILTLGLISINMNIVFSQELSFMSKSDFTPLTQSRFVNLSKQISHSNYWFASSNYNSAAMFYHDIDLLHTKSFYLNSFTIAKKHILAYAPKLNNKISIKYSEHEENGSENPGKKESFFTEELLYFAGAAALTATFYLVWSDNNNSVNKKSFGLPPKP